MNEVLILERTKPDSDDGMFGCYTGTINGWGEPNLATFGEQRRADWFIKSFLRKTNKSVGEYSSTEEVIVDFLDYCMSTEVEGVEYDMIESLNQFKEMKNDTKNR